MRISALYERAGVLFAFLTISAGVGCASSPEIVFLPIRPDPRFDHAVEPNALRHACSERLEALESYFREQATPFERALVRPREGLSYCHIAYRASLPGFRLAPETERVEGLFASVDSLAFTIGRSHTGDSLDVVSSVLERLSEPMHVELSLIDLDAPDLWESARIRRFAGSRHTVVLRPTRGSKLMPWGQDYVKSGVVGSQLRLLKPRRVFEGRPEVGASSASQLDSLNDARFAVSQLAWEGGDIMAAAAPDDPDRTILFHGGAAATYWGVELTRQEYSHVLRIEFGADETVDMSDFSPHVDYIVSILPDHKTALVADVVSGDRRLAQAAADVLAAELGARAAPELSKLRALLRSEDAFTQRRDELRRLTAALAARPALAPRPWDPAVVMTLNEYFAQNCPADPRRCLDGPARTEMFRRNPDLARLTMDAAIGGEVESILAPRLISLIDAQLSEMPAWSGAPLTALVERLTGLGFRVVRTPFLPGQPDKHAWVGVSYVNLLGVGDQLFVPMLGLGAYESSLVADMRSLLPRYNIVPIPARLGVLSNGGVHCVVGPVRAVRPRFVAEARRD